MFRTSVLALSVVVVLNASSIALAQGNGHANGHGNNQVSGQGNNGNASSNAGGNGNGNSGGNGNAGSAVTITGGPQGTTAPDLSSTTGTPNGDLSENDVLEAVEAGRAVSLSRILPDLRARTGGEVIDAQLQQVGSFLVYAIKILTPEGKVTTEFYYARSGLPVER
jgi:hypothetical protein